MGKLISVVLADSSEDFRKLLGEHIDWEEDMYVAASTDDGLEAVELVAQLRPDVLISELLLRKIEGIALVSRLNGRGIQPSTILVSGFYNEYVASLAGELGVKRFFPKPCRVAELIEAVRCCGGREGERARGMMAPDERSRRMELEKSIDEAMFHSGIMPSLNGREYLRAALLAAAENRELLLGVTKVLYPELAARFDTSAANFERCISRAIERAWRDGSREKRIEYFGREYEELLERKPGNTLYMKLVLERIDRNSKSGRK